jgi:hypothetical protein
MKRSLDDNSIYLQLYVWYWCWTEIQDGRYRLVNSLFVSHYLFESDERYRLLGASCLLCDIHTLYLFWILNCYLINSNTCLILDIPGIDKFKDV